MNLELVVFDVAGTTVAASDDVARVFREAFEARQLDLTSEAVAAVRGKSKRDAIRELVSLPTRNADQRVDPDEIHRDFRDRLIKASASWRPVSGAQETFAWFRARDIQVALTTGFDRVVLEALLESLGWAYGVVDSALCAEDVAHGRPAPDLILRSMELCGVSDPLEVLSVGDTRADLEAAENAGVGWSIGVLSGAHSADELSLSPHSAILNSVADLPAWYRRRVISYQRS